MYTLTEEKKILEEQEYVAYGIRYNSEYCIDDVSADKEAVKRLVANCNKYELDPVHLRDVVEDFLTEEGA